MRFGALLTVLSLGMPIPATSLAEEAAESDAAQAQPADAPAAAQGEPATDQPAAAAPDEALLSEAELEQLVAPIALYPDPLLSQILIASTYPLEVVQADRWAEKNTDLKGDALSEALAEQDWDDSIKALVGVPDALDMMNKDIDWTEKLGNAVLAQQPDVMDAIQGLRARAKDNGQLESNAQQTVTVTQTVVQGGEAPPEDGQQTSSQATKDVIVIEPTDPEIIYVPYYQPSVVYGSWPYPAYQPYYFPPPVGYGYGSALARGLAWSAGFAIGNAIWGNGFNWGRNDIYVNRNVNISGNTINRNNVNVQKWEHNSAHRRGVEYNNNNVRNKYANKNQVNRNNVGNRSGGPGDRRPGDMRPGDGNLADRRPGDGSIGDRRPGEGGLGDRRPGEAGGKRPTVGDMEAALKKPGAGDRQGAGNKRPATGNRPSTGGIQDGLKNKPGAARPAAKKPTAKKPTAKKPSVSKPVAKKPSPTRSAAKTPANKTPSKKTPSRSKPTAKKPQVSRPSGTAFHKRDGANARSASSRGRASAGGRSAKSFSRGRSGGGGHRGGGRRR